LKVIYPEFAGSGATRRIRTDDLLITNAKKGDPEKDG
jgi:hypothetical protein